MCDATTRAKSHRPVSTPHLPEPLERVHIDVKLVPHWKDPEMKDEKIEKIK